MTDVSDYQQRVAYYQRRYVNNREVMKAKARAYRARNREAVLLARQLSIPVPLARRLMRAIGLAQ